MALRGSLSMGQTPTLHWPCSQSRCGLAGVTEHGADVGIALAMQSRCGLAGVSMGPRGVTEHRVASRGSAWSRPWPALHCHAVSHGVASRGSAWGRRRYCTGRSWQIKTNHTKWKSRRHSRMKNSCIELYTAVTLCSLYSLVTDIHTLTIAVPLSLWHFSA